MKYWIRLVAAVSLIGWTPASQARTWRVTSDGLGDAPTIQAAIDSSAVGDSILVGAGVYEENLVLSPSRTVIGSWDESFLASDLASFTTTLDGDSTTSVVIADFGEEGGLNSLLAGFRVHGGAGSLIDGARRGGGIYGNGLSRVERCLVEKNFADSGGGVYLSSETVEISDCVIVGNSALESGGGIHIEASEEATIRRSVIGGNWYPDPLGPTALRGAGLFVNGGRCLIDSTDVSGNGILGYLSTSDACLGGGICSLGSYLEIRRSTINGNQLMIGEQAGAYGAAVYADSVFIESSSIIGNGLIYGVGGGVFARACRLSSCKVTGNSGNAGKGWGRGGGLTADWAEVSNCLFADNFSAGLMGAEGGGIYAGELWVKNTVVKGNRVNNHNSVNSGRGGGIWAKRFDASNLVLLGNVCSTEHPAQGVAAWSDSTESATMRSSVIAGHVASEDGDDRGVLFGNFTSRSNLFFDNEIDLFSGGSVDSSGHIHAAPLFADTLTGDFHLLLHSPAIDRGDPSVLDPDGSRSDIGAYGGPGAVMSQPARVVGPQGAASGYGVALDWSGVTAPDLSGYALYRSSIPGAHPELSTLLDLPDGLSDSFLDRFAFPGSTYFYRISAYDSSNYGGGYSDEIASTAAPWSGEGGFGASSNVFGIGAGHQFGAAVLAIDLNGDGIDDLVASAPGNETGRVLVFWGGAPFNPVSAIDADVSILAPRSGEEFGWVLGAGDVAGDENEDLLIGASRASPMGRTNAGAVYVIEGRTNWPTSPITIDLAVLAADKTILGAAAEDRSGSSMAMGDFNDDASGDFAIGSPEHITPAGKRDGEVRVLYSISVSPDSIDLASSPAPFTVIRSDSAGLFSGDRLGSALASGDVNDDGVDDLVIGSRGEDPSGKSAAGVVHVIHGYSGIEQLGLIDLALSPASLRIEGADVDDQLGSAVSVLDLDGDGLNEIAIGAPTAKRPHDTAVVGAAYMVRVADVEGSVLSLDAENSWISLHGDGAGSLFGSALAVGRASASPESNLWIGARGATSGRGEAVALWGGRSVYPGIISLEQSAMDWKIEGPLNTGGASTPFLGGTVAVGDFDGNGTLDFATGAFGADLGPFHDAGVVPLLLNEDATHAEEPISASPTVDRLRLSRGGANPARGAVRLSLAVPRDEEVEVVVYDVAGRRVWGESWKCGAGITEVLWPATTAGGAHVAAGVYIAQAISESEKATLRLLIVR